MERKAERAASEKEGITQLLRKQANVKASDACKISNQRKFPQRGLGVAQLERLRLLEQRKQLLQLQQEVEKSETATPLNHLSPPLCGMAHINPCHHCCCQGQAPFGFYRSAVLPFPIRFGCVSSNHMFNLLPVPPRPKHNEQTAFRTALTVPSSVSNCAASFPRTTAAGFASYQNVEENSYVLAYAASAPQISRELPSFQTLHQDRSAGRDHKSLDIELPSLKESSPPNNKAILQSNSDLSLNGSPFSVMPWGKNALVSSLYNCRENNRKRSIAYSEADVKNIENHERTLKRKLGKEKDFLNLTLSTSSYHCGIQVESSEQPLQQQIARTRRSSTTSSSDFVGGVVACDFLERDLRKSESRDEDDPPFLENGSSSTTFCNSVGICNKACMRLDLSLKLAI